MTQSEDKAQWGFDLLLERRPNALDRYFDALNESGLLAAEQAPGPVRGEQEGFVRIPLWPALNYLAAVAKLAGDRNDEKLAQKILSIVQAVSQYQESDGSRRDNYRTYTVFAEIIGSVPLSVVEMEYIEFIPIWLSSKFDRDSVAAALSQGILRRTLMSDTPGHLDMACRILYHCTALRWETEAGFSDERTKAVTFVHDDCLKELINEHVPAFGQKKGQEAADIFIERLKEVFSPGRTHEISYLSRTAVEEHPQNHSWEGPENRFVEGLRDLLSHWIEHDPGAVHDFVYEMLNDDTDIISRIAIHTLNHHWGVLSDLYLPAASVALFHSNHLHELYELLQTHFGQMNEEAKAVTLKTIRQLPANGDSEDRERRLRRKQRNWLSAIAGKGYEPADKWYAELNADESIGKLTAHPGFHHYMESWSGPSAYSPQQLIKFADEGKIVDVLNGFEETDNWHGPTIRALSDVLVKAVKERPQLFLDIRQDFLQASRPYQYGFVNGFKQLWDVAKDGQTKIDDWDRAWEQLIEFFEQLLQPDNFWQEVVETELNMTPNRDWITPVIVELLRAGTLEDKHSYPAVLLPRTWEIIVLLLEKVMPESKAHEEDAMQQAVNSTKGKTIKALFSHALRACRVSDKAGNDHQTIWTQMQPMFDNELQKCQDANFEFSTLAGTYSPNLAYMSQDWLEDNIQKIFSQDHQNNCICALNGLAYAPVSTPVYQLLVEQGILDRVLKWDLKGHHTRESLLQRIALAYLWNDEALDGPRFNYLFESISLDDLKDISDYFLRLSNQELTAEQVTRILIYWKRTIKWSQSLEEPPAKLLSSLSRLSCYLKAINYNNLQCLLAVASYVDVDHDGDRFIEELERFADDFPVEVSQVFGRVLENYQPHYDYEDKMQSLIRKIAQHSVEERTKAIAYTDKLIGFQIRGMQELLDELNYEIS